MKTVMTKLMLWFSKVKKKATFVIFFDKTTMTLKLSEEETSCWMKKYY